MAARSSPEDYFGVRKVEAQYVPIPEVPIDYGSYTPSLFSDKGIIILAIVAICFLATVLYLSSRK